MNRREALSLLTVAGAAAAAAPVFAAPVAAAKADPYEALAAAAAECVNSGSACIQHCLQSLGSGSTMMAECSKTVVDMLAQARALVDLAHSRSKHLAAAAKVGAALAKDCEAACRKHESMHATCKRCADCCAKLSEAVAALPA